MSARTPGPWFAVETFPGSLEFIRDSSGGDIAMLQDQGSNADARLIAAAPDLLAALEQMVSRFESLDDGDGSLQQSRAAIAKATQS